jgi:outer membrane protein OmpA-like peptidoglycan-associated protein/Tfp pilus assembly protein PilF/Tol biopolymer transport system component
MQMLKKKHHIQKVLFAFFIFNFSFFISRAQWYEPEKVNKKAGEIYALAIEAAQERNFTASLKHLNEALALDPKFVDVFLTRSNVYAEMKNYNASVADFETALKMDSVYSKVYLLPYSISLAGAGKFQQAFNAVNTFLANPTLNTQSIKAGNYRRSVYQFAIDHEKKHPAKDYVFTPVNLGENINTNNLEYFPSLTIDGTKMIFNRRITGDEDFYESNFVNGKWEKAEPLGGKVNTNLNEGAQNISQDGQLLIFTGCNYPEGEGSCDLYFSVRTNNGWSEAQNLGPVVNTDLWESSPSLSADKRDLYFASRRHGGFGGSDIWVTHRLPSGKWSSPENLGEAVNTKGDEGCPFMHADNETLYFTSNGLTGYGKTDLFFSKKVNDSSWVVAENLGYPINTIDDEGSLIVAADGKTAYYASDGADSKGGLDIYSFQLREDVRPLKTLWVKGKVFDKKTNAGLPSAVELMEIKTGNLISRIQTDEDGNYLVPLPVGKDYAFNVNRRGYLFYSDNFSLSKNNVDSVFRVDIALQPIEKGATIVLKNIFFETGKFELKNESKSELDKLVKLLNDNPNLKIQLDGHTDNVGQEKDNLLLSTNRAKAVVGYLLSKSININRLAYKGFGSAKPVSYNSTEQGKALNRRTELSITGN